MANIFETNTMTGASSAEEQARKSKRKGKQLHWNNIKESNKIEAATNEIKSNQVKTNVGFCAGGKTGGPGEKTSQSRVKNQQTQATYDAETGNRTTLVEGARSHYCANPALEKRSLIASDKSHRDTPCFKLCVLSGNESNVLRPLHISFSTRSLWISNGLESLSTTMDSKETDRGSHWSNKALRWTRPSVCLLSLADIFRFRDFTIWSVLILSL